MNQNKFDIGIIGAGVAGSFAALKLAESHKNVKTVLFDLGRPQGKRRRQIEGWFGCFPTGDGKIYVTDEEKVCDISDKRKVNAANKWFFNHLNAINSSKVIKSKHPDLSVQKKIKEHGFEIELKNYIQWNPDSIHQLSKVVAEEIESSGNVTFSFDNEVHSLIKRGNVFVIETDEGEYICKKIILCVGRSGWRWVNKLYKDFGILASDDIATFGLRIEIGAQYMKGFNKSHCVLSRNDLQIGPICWGGSVIQEDHADLTISAFRSNEERWKSDKVMFSIIGNRRFAGTGTTQTDRLGKLAFLLGGDRVGRERLRMFTKGETQLNQIPEYGWLADSIKEISDFIPAIINRSFFHFPDIRTMTSKINIGSNLETEIEGLFVCGESAGVEGIAAAGIMGAIAAGEACK
jgi:uncharacterized FAD-dependent dehydrogenase